MRLAMCRGWHGTSSVLRPRNADGCTAEVVASRCGQVLCQQILQARHPLFLNHTFGSGGIGPEASTRLQIFCALAAGGGREHGKPC